MRDLSKPIASLLTVRLHPGWVRAGGRFHLALLRRFPRAGLLGGDTLVLTTRGRRSGRARSTPVYCVRRGDRLYVAASFAGSDAPPNWYLNLVADPRVEVDLAGRHAGYRARVLSQDEAAPVWAELATIYRPFLRYQRRTRRLIPVVELTPAAGAATAAA
jgi:deazaflavin-dependent oxidoreductase (nitroreductase family)